MCNHSPVLTFFFSPLSKTATIVLGLVEPAVVRASVLKFENDQFIPRFSVAEFAVQSGQPASNGVLMSLDTKETKKTQN